MCSLKKQIRRWDFNKQNVYTRKGRGEEARLGKGRFQIMMQVWEELCPAVGSSRTNTGHQRNLQWAEMDRAPYLHLAQSLTIPKVRQLRQTLKKPVNRGCLLSSASLQQAEMYSLRKNRQHISVSIIVHLCTLSPLALAAYPPVVWWTSFPKRNLEKRG